MRRVPGVGQDRAADVFPDAESLWLSGWTDRSESDLMAVTDLSPLVGIPANGIPYFHDRQAGRGLGEWQAEVNACRSFAGWWPAVGLSLPLPAGRLR